MFRVSTINKRGFVSQQPPVSNKALVDGPDTEVLYQRTEMVAHKVQPYGASTRLFTEAYKRQPAQLITLSSDTTGFDRSMRESYAWKAAVEENKRVQRAVDAAMKSENIMGLVNRIYTPKAVEVSGLNSVTNAASDSIRAAVDTINSIKGKATGLSYPEGVVPPANQTSDTVPPKYDPEAQPPSSAMPTQQPTGTIPPAQIPATMPTGQAQSTPTGHAPGESAVGPAATTATALTVRSLVITATPTRRSLPQLTSSDMLVLVCEGYRPGEKITDLKYMIAAEPAPIGREFEDLTITAINFILYGGGSVEDARSLYSLFQSVGVMYTLLNDKGLRQTTLYRLIHEALARKGFADEMLLIHGPGYYAAAAYELLASAPMATVDQQYLTTVLDRVIQQYEGGFRPFVRALFNAVTIILSPDLKVEIPLDESDPHYYLKWLVWRTNQAAALARSTTQVVQSAPGTIYDTVVSYSAMQLPQTMSYAVEEITEQLTQRWMMVSFSVVSAGNLLNLVQNRPYMNRAANGIVFGSLAAFATLQCVYRGLNLLTAGLMLAWMFGQAVQQYRVNGRIRALEQGNLQLADQNRAQGMQLIEALGALRPTVDLPRLVLTTIVATIRQLIDRGLVVLNSGRFPAAVLDGFSTSLEKLGGLNSARYTMKQNRAELRDIFREMLVTMGMPRNIAESVIASMTNADGNFRFYHQPDGGPNQMFEDLYDRLLEYKDEMRRFMTAYFNGSRATDGFKRGELKKFLRRFGATLKIRNPTYHDEYEDMNPARDADLERWVRLLAYMFLLERADVMLVIAASDVDTEVDPATMDDPGPPGQGMPGQGVVYGRDTFANEIIKFTPDWSLDHIAASDMPANLRWHAYKRRRQDIMDSFSVIFQSMGATKEDTDAALNSLVNNGGFRSNGRHGSYPTFAAFLTKYSDAFAQFFARYPVDRRLQYAAIFCSRFFALRGRTMLISKIFGLAADDMKKLAEATVPIDPVKMDFTWQDGDKPSGPEPTTAQLSAYERPTRKPVSRGGEL
jgi:hypothetical protein